jgi:hypothetical protein
VLARVILESAEPRDLPRLRELAARPARLLPPYAHTPAGVPVWSDDLPQVTLAPFLTRPIRVLPLAVDAELHPRARATTLRLRLHELYGRVAQAGPSELDASWQSREDDRIRGRATAALTPSGADVWSAEVPVDLAGLGAGTWDLRLTVRFADGAQREVTAHALTGAGRLRRRAVPSVRHGVLLVQPYATHSGALALRVATGVRGAAKVVRGRLRRLLH